MYYFQLQNNSFFYFDKYNQKYKAQKPTKMINLFFFHYYPYIIFHPICINILKPPLVYFNSLHLKHDQLFLLITLSVLFLLSNHKLFKYNQ